MKKKSLFNNYNNKEIMKNSIKSLMLSILLATSLLQSCMMPATMTVAKVIDVAIAPETSKDELFVRSNTWMVENFNNAESVIQFSDKEAGIVAGKYTFFTKSVSVSMYDVREVESSAMIKIKVKNGAAQISITPNPISFYDSMGTEEAKYREEISRNIKALVNDFKISVINAESFEF